ncbi:MAG: hypothetical protein M1816_008096 [Peltula sp. TS41687]|nr:MAG: hypothetical protein M1816_008096 [Peltula sp. TS41687]
MSKRQTKPQASSERAAFGAQSSETTFGTRTGFFGRSSNLSYLTEPPDLSTISDADVTVAFKNLSKKDETTKSKALEELQSHIASWDAGKEKVEDGVLEAWVHVYPRLSIDASRRVRQLAHILQGQIVTVTGRQFARRMPFIIGAWLCGTYDNDRLARTAAQEGFQRAFSTEEKRLNVLKVYLQSILEHCRASILRETVRTLSDERIVSPDDAEAKHARVVGTGIFLLDSLIGQLMKQDLAKEEKLLGTILTDFRLWGYTAHKDSFVRRSMYKLIRTLLSEQSGTYQAFMIELSSRSSIDLVASLLPVIGSNVLSKALGIDQTGSAREYSSLLAYLTSIFPGIWKTESTKKKPAISYLPEYLKRGSQGGPSQVWDDIGEVLERLPKDILPTAVKESLDLLEAMHEGLLRKEEPRTHIQVAWAKYFSLAHRLASLMPSEDDQCNLLKESIFPIFEQYIKSTSNSRWSVGINGTKTCATAFNDIGRYTAGNVRQALEAEWWRLAQLIVDDMKISQPEQSKEFHTSQMSVAGEGDRFGALNAEILRISHELPFATPLLRKTSIFLTRIVLEVLRSRDGKPFGASLLLEALLRYTPALILKDDEALHIISDFMSDGLHSMAMSPSFKSLLSCLCLFQSYAPTDATDDKSFGRRMSLFRRTLNATIRTILAEPDPERKAQAIHMLLSSLNENNQSNEKLDAGTELEEFILRCFKLAMQGETRNWELVNEALRNEGRVLSADTRENLLTEMMNGLSVEEKAPVALQGLEVIAKENKALLRRLVSSNSKMLINIISLTESPDERLASEAKDLKTTIESILAGEGDQELGQSMVGLVHDGLSGAGPTSVTVQSLVEHALKIISTKPESLAKLANDLLPASDKWMEALKPFLSLRPNPSLAITDRMGGAIYMIDKVSKDPASTLGVPRDWNGYPAALRMAMYVTQIIRASEISKHIDTARRGDIFEMLLLTVQLVNDNIGISGPDSLWRRNDPDNETEILDFTSESQNLVSHWLGNGEHERENSKEDGDTDYLEAVMEKLKRRSSGTSPSAFYNARAMCYILQESSQLQERHALNQEAALRVLRSLRKTPEMDIFGSISLLLGNHIPELFAKETSHAFNELAGAITGAEFSNDDQDNLRLLVLLNSILQYGDMALETPQHRLVLFVKTLLDWVEQGLLDSSAATAEVARVLSATVPLISTVYGSRWSMMMEFINQVWSHTFQDDSLDLRLPAIHATLRLFAVLRKIHGDNDDAEDAWKSSLPNLNQRLIELLKRAPNVSDDSHQPLRVVNSLLARQIALIPIEQIKDASEMYSLVYAESPTIQQAAFELLHRCIPAKLEQISIEVALTKSSARLPEELISLIVEIPRAETALSGNWGSHMPLNVRGFLFSWILVFDHFSGSSYKVRSDYVAHLKEGNYVSGLLDFSFRVLGHDGGKPVDASRFDITSYSPDTEDSPQKDLQWLLIHLYYLSLKHLPSLTKAWWIDSPKRQTAQTIESWTEKYISPIVISDELNNITSWAAESTAQQDEDKNMKVKVSKNAREITASYEVDEQTMQIVIKLPGAYPLSQATVEGLNRVAVDEKKWRSWLLNTRGVITFSNGSIIDGLTAWGKNVTGALKGQTECAICYSIISADKQLPTKKCSTCKNLFHSSKLSIQVVQDE